MTAIYSIGGSKLVTSGSETEGNATLTALITWQHWW